MTSLWAKAYLNIYILHSFIGHSLEERRKILKRKQRKGIIIDIKLIYYTSVNSNMRGTRHFVRVGVFSKKNENFDNPVEFVLLKALFTHYNLLESLIGK